MPTRLAGNIKEQNRADGTGNKWLSSRANGGCHSTPAYCDLVRLWTQYWQIFGYFSSRKSSTNVKSPKFQIPVTNLETAYLLCSHTQDQHIYSNCGVMTVYLYATQFSFPLGLYFKYLTILVPPPRPHSVPRICSWLSWWRHSVLIRREMGVS